MSLQVNDHHRANFCGKSSACCCNSLLLTQHQTPFTHALSPPEDARECASSSGKLHYLARLPACLPLIIRPADPPTRWVSAARRHVAVAAAEATQFCPLPTHPPTPLFLGTSLVLRRAFSPDWWPDETRGRQKSATVKPRLQTALEDFPGGRAAPGDRRYIPKLPGRKSLHFVLGKTAASWRLSAPVRVLLPRLSCPVGRAEAAEVEGPREGLL